jgi:hypothetical protein
MAVPVHQSTTSLVIPNGSSSGSLAFPAGIAAGNLLLLVAARSNTALGNFTVPGGFAQTGTSQAGASPSFAIWYKIADGTESGSASVGHDSSTSVKTLWMHRFTSVDGAVPIHVAPTTSGAGSGSGTVVMRSVTTTANACLALHVEVGNTQSGPMSGSESGETGGDWVVRYNAQPTGGQPHVLHTADMHSAGVISGGSFGLTVVNQNWRASGMALRGDAAAAGSVSASAEVSLSPSGTLIGVGNVSASALATLATTGTLRGLANVMGGATATLAATGTLRGIAGLAGAAAISLGVSGHLESGPQVTPAAPEPTGLGGGWDARRFRRLLEERRRTLLARIRSLPPRDEASVDDVSASVGRETDRLAERVATFAIAPVRQGWRLREQAAALAALERRLIDLTKAIANEVREREIEELILLAA